jgi:hypothetical protein
LADQEASTEDLELRLDEAGARIDQMDLELQRAHTEIKMKARELDNLKVNLGSYGAGKYILTESIDRARCHADCFV